MKFTFFKRQRVLLPIFKIANREFNALSRTELAKLQNFSLFFREVGGRLGVIWTFGFFGKSKARWNFLFPFLKIVHQKGLLGTIKQIMKFCNCRRILDIYSQGLLGLSSIFPDRRSWNRDKVDSRAMALLFDNFIPFSFNIKPGFYLWKVFVMLSNKSSHTAI